MNTEYERKLEQYAEVIVKVGLNVQPGQRVLIGPPLLFVYGVSPELAPLVRQITKMAYQQGASFVDVIWDDPQLRLLRLQHAPAESAAEFATWPYEEARRYAENGDAVLFIYAQSPDLLDGQNPDTVSALQQLAFQHSGATWNLVGEGAFNWSMISAPVEGWTEKLFPDLPPDEARSRFWEVIFEISRITGDQPVAGWQRHIQQLAKLGDTMNSKRYASLHYRAPGTDLTIGLPGGHVWNSGALTTQQDIAFVANIPTEEVFTLSHRQQVEGIVTATKTLSYEGTLIENFTLTFEYGQVVKATADRGETQLNRMLDTDAGARRLGEVALVPHSSPISQTGLLFHNILIDENAANHLALGQAYKFTMQDGTGMSDEAFTAAGGNLSLIHTDFMIGSGAMDVDGIRDDGTSEPVLRAGEWAFEV
jgi:aminopeptidase